MFLWVKLYADPISEIKTVKKWVFFIAKKQIYIKCVAYYITLRDELSKYVSIYA